MVMTIEYIRYTIPEDRAEAFEAAYRVAQAHLKDAPECLGFELSRCEEAPTSYILRIRWTSTEAHLEGFRKGPHFRPFLGHIRPFIADIAEMRHYTPLDVCWSRS